MISLWRKAPRPAADELRSSRRYREAGFTLIEILVAMMILTIGVTVVFELFSEGLNARRRADHHTLAMLHAREEMEEILSAPALKAESLEGSFGDGFSWRAQIQPVPPPDTSGPQLRVSLFQVDLTVFWTDNGQRRQVDLSTQALAPAPAPEPAF